MASTDVEDLITRAKECETVVEACQVLIEGMEARAKNIYDKYVIAANVAKVDIVNHTFMFDMYTEACVASFVPAGESHKTLRGILFREANETFQRDMATLNKEYDEAVHVVLQKIGRSGGALEARKDHVGPGDASWTASPFEVALEMTQDPEHPENFPGWVSAPTPMDPPAAMTQMACEHQPGVLSPASSPFGMLVPRDANASGQAKVVQNRRIVPYRQCKRSE